MVARSTAIVVPCGMRLQTVTKGWSRGVELIQNTVLYPIGCKAGAETMKLHPIGYNVSAEGVLTELIMQSWERAAFVPNSVFL